jgi:hypothetical protein
MQLAWGFAPPLTIGVAVRNRVFDFLDATPHTVEEVAEYAKGSTRGWRAVLNCLAGIGLLRLAQESGESDWHSNHSTCRSRQWIGHLFLQ